jgi:DNA-binding transcriptional LysR family regulator
MINVSRIDLNLFAVFDAIYTQGGITRASETLCLSQPAISHALARLRELVGDPLFVRQGNALKPTPVAHELIVPVRRALGEIEGSLNRLSTFDPQLSDREFRIGIRQVVETTAIPELVDEIKDEAPGVKIAAVHHSRAGFHTQLTNGTLAVVIDVLLPVMNDIRQQLLAGGKMVVVARAGHPAINGGLTMEAYLAQDHILASSRSTGPGAEDRELARLGLQRRIKLRCQHHWTACKVVRNSDMLLTMPERYAYTTNESLGNQIVPFPIELAAKDMFLYWHASAEDDPANRWLREQICRSFQRQ